MKELKIIKAKLSNLMNTFPVAINPDPVAMLQKALKGEIQQWDMYYMYKSLVIGPDRDSYVKEFEQHAADEASHIDILTRYIVDLGGEPTFDREPIPKLTLLSPQAILELQIKHEREAIFLYEGILSSINNEALRIDIETILAKETEHAQDLVLLRK
jgi:bacterioferritin (cytochrome b1)